MSFDEPADAIVRVLRKIGVDPQERILEFDQDPEYTACRAEELPVYFNLYARCDTDVSERAVLCCFLLEGLNEYCAAGAPHSLQSQIFDTLFDADPLHADELAYWMNTSDPDPENWWPITIWLVKCRVARAAKGKP
jgi:hypothetical protein